MAVPPIDIWGRNAGSHEPAEGGPMIEEGQKKKVRYWGDFCVSNVARLKKPVECRCNELGVALFDPAIVKIRWETPPSGDKDEFWFPYSTEIRGKQYQPRAAPMIGEGALLELLENAIAQGFFSRSFLQGLSTAITAKLGS